jgi:ATP-dependent exoDNAse (exonuclease V) alpha subunit
MQQAKALKILKSGANVFLTGSAGTGKTYVLNQYIQYLKARKVPVAITASTGIAATHMNGMTIHSWAGIGIKQQLTPRDLKLMEGKKYLKDKLEAAKVLIIDEVSMLHKSQLAMVDLVLRSFKNSNDAFGGIQVVFAGDFFQLPPIGNHGELPRDKFAFMAECWVNAGVKVCYLTEQYRQSKNALTDVLNEIRSGSISQSSLTHLAMAKSNEITDNAPKLYTHNVDVEKINTEELLKLSGEIKSYKATTKGNEKLVDTLKNAVLAGDTLSLKKHAQVMFVKNNPETGVVNGSLGTVESFTDEDAPVVRLKTGQRIIVEPETWSMNDDKGKALAEFTQLPLRLAWAITIHKSQGMTLDASQIDLSKTFEKGQGYVALSRLKDLSGLKLLGFNQTALEVDELARKADARFQQLSLEGDLSAEEATLELLAKSFLAKVDGLTDDKEIKKYANKLKDKKDVKLATHEKTAQLVQNGNSIGAIAEKRGLGESTILNHIIKISELMPEVDLTSCKPDQETLDRVKEAFNMLQAKSAKGQGTGPGLKNLYAALNAEMDYNAIKLALLFLK